MNTDDIEVKQEVYQIPANYEDDGGILGGKFTKRNGFDMAIICGPILLINAKLIFPNCTLKTSIIVLMCTVIPPLALCALGIGGESLSQMFLAYIRFRKRKRKMSYIGFYKENERPAQKKPFSFAKFLDDISSFGFKKAMQENIANSKQNNVQEPPAETDVASQRETQPHPKKAAKVEKRPKESHFQHKAPAKKPDHSHSRRLVGSALKEKLLEKLELGDDDDY